MITTSAPEPAPPPTPPPAFGRWTAEHPTAAFVLLTYGISWPLFLAARVGGWVLIAVGAFGPAAAGAIVTHQTGGSARSWFRSIWRWGVPGRWYLYALGLPPLLVVVTAFEAAALGDPIRIDDPATIVPEYLGTLLVVAVLGGGQEEPGWRGFLLDRYQQRYTPLRATVFLGIVWGAWHLPVYGLGGFAGPALLVVFYTWLYNRTGSVPLCILLHAGFNTAIGYLDLANAPAAVTLAFLATGAVASAALVAFTRRRLGLTASPLFGTMAERGEDSSTGGGS